MKKLRDLFSRLLPVGAKSAKAKAADAEAKAFTRQAEMYRRYIYLNPGLNRHERRSLGARIIRSKKITTRGSSLFMTDAERKIARFQLKESPKNRPVRWPLSALARLKVTLLTNPFYKSARQGQ